MTRKGEARAIRSFLQRHGAVRAEVGPQATTGSVDRAAVKCAYLLRVSIDELDIVIYISILSELLQYTAHDVGTICTVDVVIAIEVGILGDDNLNDLSRFRRCCGRWWWRGGFCLQSIIRVGDSVNNSINVKVVVVV